MDLVNPEFNQYAERHTTDESDLLKKINRETHAQVLKPRMLSGHLQGRLLAMLSCMISPQVVLEIGTYTGYSAICLAQGLHSGGKLITIDNNEELEDRVRNYFAMAGLSNVIDYRIGDAHTIIPLLKEQFDLVFIDADKENYSTYFNMIIDSVKPGGYILADNVLWSGKVLDTRPDKDTRAIQDFNMMVQADPRVENVLLPIRDGIMIMRRLSL